MGFFADGPGTGSTAAAGQNFGLSIAAEQRVQTGQTVSDAYGPVSSFDPTADRLSLGSGPNTADSMRVYVKPDGTRVMVVGDGSTPGTGGGTGIGQGGISLDRQFDNIAEMAAAYKASGMSGATGDATDSYRFGGTLATTTVAEPAMTAAEMAAFDAQNGAPGAWSPPTTSALDALQQGWHQQGWSLLQNGSQAQQPLSSFVYGVGQGSRQLFDSVTGAGSMRQAQQAWQRGDYVRAPLHVMQSVAEAGLSVFGAGELLAPKTAVVGTVTRPLVSGPRQTGAGGAAGAADELYASIRASNTDVASIAENTGIKASNIGKVKDHLFYNEHLLDRYESLGVPGVMQKFDSNADIAAAWKRLESGAFVEADKQLLRHETAEAWYMNKYGPSYNNSHNAAQKRYPSPLE